MPALLASGKLPTNGYSLTRRPRQIMLNEVRSMFLLWLSVLYDNLENLLLNDVDEDISQVPSHEIVRTTKERQAPQTKGLRLAKI